MITLKNIFKTYSNGSSKINALENINLDIPEGSIFGIVGGSGAGKSSLLRCINMLERPTSGQVFYGNQEINTLSEYELRNWRSHAGMIFQHFNLLHSRTVFENIALPLELRAYSKTKIKEAVEPLLKLTHLVNKAEAFPSQLSGGQKQRVAIARALVNKPKVLLCDEATSALDPETTEQILRLLKDINRSMNLTVILITHEIEVVKSICDKVALLDHGKLIEVDDTTSFFTRPRSKLAQKFVKNSLKLTLPLSLQSQIFQTQSLAHSHPILKISFKGKETTQPILSEAIKKFRVDINILVANIEFIAETAIGGVLVEMKGPQENLTECIKFLELRHLRVEVVGYVA